MWTGALLGLLMASTVSAEEMPLPSVDLGIREVDAREISVISRRTEEDWWALVVLRADFEKRRDGVPRDEERTFPFRIYRSADAGISWREDAAVTEAVVEAVEPHSHSVRSWHGGTVDFLVWYTPEVGLMAGVFDAGVLRTIDGGRTWSRIALARGDAFRVYELERAGGRTWMCGSTDSIYRSDDTGATWRELPGTPFNSDDRCVGLSFLDAKRGWAAGMKGSLWATEDGGATWSRMPTAWPPTPDPFWPQRPTDLEDVALFTPKVAWVQSSAGRFQTTDGGKTWHPRMPATEDSEEVLRVTPRASGQSWVTVGTTEESPMPSLSDQDAVMGADTVVTIHGDLLHTFVAGRRVRVTPLTTPGSGVLTPLDGVLTLERERWVGWTGAKVLLSHDQGLSWFTVGLVPEAPLRTLVFAKDGRLFAQAQSENLFVSWNLGRTWNRSTTWLDAHDFAVATGVPPERLETPLQCLLIAPEAEVTVRFDISDCWPRSKNHLALNLANDHATLSGRYEAHQNPLEVHSRKLTREAARRILRGLVSAATQQETQLRCESIMKYTTLIEWSCSPDGTDRRTLEFIASGCGVLTPADIMGGGTMSGGAEPTDYARALGVYDLAVRALEGTVR
ncbi:glycosyl hydrolase [Myxococcus stipitatus DSM 14675]|uniref:Glycosyl hydrolase n=1 Tax=Myxococcus stipitatus (strain DSM 14675 / JCM 12634 / Mx s8) TaxID=1278073 RepID=L7UAD4_MYXSD|nr:glycosyl hydrolase [Myxococcus stipitatus DSM 14675]